QGLEGLDAVRKRPAMYIGSTEVKGLHHLAYEVIDNAVDEALSGFGNDIIVSMHKDNSITIAHNAVSTPARVQDTGKPTTEVIFTVLHAGGKFGKGGYKSSGGLHGVGAAVVNALSEWLEVTTYRNGMEYYQHFENGGKPTTELVNKGKTNKKGSIIRFKPDANIFSTTDFKLDTLSDRLREAAFL